MAKTKHQPYLHLATQIEGGLASLAGFNKPLSDEIKADIEKLKIIQNLLLSGDTYSLLEFGLEHLKDKPFRLTGGSQRETNDEKLDRLQTEWVVAKNIIINSPHGPIKKYSTKHGLNKRKEELQDELNECLDGMSQADLKDLFIELVIEYEKANQVVAAFRKEIDFLGSALNEKYIDRRKKAVNSQVTGKKIKNSYDYQSKKAGIDLLKKILNRDLVGTDFSEYVVIMEDERLAPKNLEKTEWRKTDGWPIASLRAFFNEETGLKPSFNKRNAAKIRGQLMQKGSLKIGTKTRRTITLQGLKTK